MHRQSYHGLPQHQFEYSFHTHRYLNQYAKAEEKVKDIAKRLINIEEKLTVDIRSYL